MWYTNNMITVSTSRHFKRLAHNTTVMNTICTYLHYVYNDGSTIMLLQCIITGQWRGRSSAGGSGCRIRARLPESRSSRKTLHFTHIIYIYIYTVVAVLISISGGTGVSIQTYTIRTVPIVLRSSRWRVVCTYLIL